MSFSDDVQLVGDVDQFAAFYLPMALGYPFFQSFLVQPGVLFQRLADVVHDKM